MQGNSIFYLQLFDVINSFIELLSLKPLKDFKKKIKLFPNKVVLFKAGSRGILESIAEEFVKQGAIVAFSYLSSE